MEHPLQHPPRDGATLSAGTQRSEPPAAMGSGGPQGASWLDTRRSVVAMLRRSVPPCAGRRLFTFRQHGLTTRGADGNFAAGSRVAGTRSNRLRGGTAGIFFRSACRRAAASPMAERQGDSRTGWTSHRPVASDLAVRRRVAHGIQPKSRAAGERSTASYTACASSARRDSLLPIFPKRPARGARRRGDGRGARILLGRGRVRVRVRGRVRGRGRGRVTP